MGAAYARQIYAQRVRRARALTGSVGFCAYLGSIPGRLLSGCCGIVRGMIFLAFNATGKWPVGFFITEAPV